MLFPRGETFTLWVFLSLIKELYSPFKAHTAVWQKWRFSASYDSFVGQQTVVLRINICGENRHLRQAAKRYASFYNDRPEFNNIKQKANQNVITWLNENNQ